MSVAHGYYPELHELVDQLRPEQTAEVRAHILRLVKPHRGGLRVLGVFDGPPEDLGRQSEEIIRREAGAT